jgi:hypothetical protein
MKTARPKPATLAQKIYGRQFDNTPIINERPDSMRSDDPDKDKALFYHYRAVRRQQTKAIKTCLR